MSARLQRHAPFLKVLYKSSPNIRRHLLSTHCNRDFIHCVCECAKNLLKGVVPLTASQLVDLRRKKAALRLLALKKTSLKKRKQIIQQGGFLGVLLGPIVKVLSSIFSN
jgi:hypothetical protein